jgi:hypothetical protein
MPLPSSGPLSSSQVATEFGVSQVDISLENLGTKLDTPITAGDPVTLPDDFYGQAGNSPVVTTSAPSSVTGTSMTLNGNVTSQGSTAVTNRGFYFGTNANYASNTKTQVGSGTGAYTLARTGLTAGTTYYVTAYAINTQGEARGSTVSQGTTGGTATSGSIKRQGTTTAGSIANRIIQRSTEEPTTGIRLHRTSNFTVNFWVKAGWTANLGSQGRYQHFWGVSCNAQNYTYTTNLYNNQFRMWFDDQLNRVWFSWLGMNSARTATGYTQNFWWLHKTGAGNAATVTGLGSSYWTNTNRGDVNDNDFCMITITYNGSMTQSNLKMYWNGNNIGTPYNNGYNGGTTTAAHTDDARLTTLLGTPYGPNGTLTGTGDQTAGYHGGNGNTIIDQYSLWDSALSSTDVAALYNEGVGGSISPTEQPEGLIVYYDFNSLSQNTSPKYSLPIWPDPAENSNKGKMEVSGSSAFESGTNTVDG